MEPIKGSLNYLVLSGALLLAACGAGDEHSSAPDLEPQGAACLLCWLLEGTIGDEPEPPLEPECDPDTAEDGCECPTDGCVAPEPDFGGDGLRR